MQTIVLHNPSGTQEACTVGQQDLDTGAGNEVNPPVPHLHMVAARCELLDDGCQLKVVAFGAWHGNGQEPLPFLVWQCWRMRCHAEGCHAVHMLSSGCSEVVRCGAD